MKIETDSHYKDALTEIAQLMKTDPPLGSPNGERLNELADAVVAYERVRFPLLSPIA